MRISQVCFSFKNSQIKSYFPPFFFYPQNVFSLQMHTCSFRRRQKWQARIYFPALNCDYFFERKLPIRAIFNVILIELSRKRNKKSTISARAISPFALRARCVMFCLSTFSHILAPLCLFWKSDVPPAGKLALRGSTVLGPWLRFRNTLLSLFHPIIDLARVYTCNDIVAPAAIYRGKIDFARSRLRRLRWCVAWDVRSWNRHARQASMAGRSAAFIYRRPRACYTQPARALLPSAIISVSGPWEARLVYPVGIART